MSSVKGKADLWRSGKNGSSPGSRKRAPGGGDDFQATADYGKQFRGSPKVGGGGMNGPVALDNQGVFANSIAGLEMDAKPFLPDPGEGRSGLDMYSVKSSVSETDFGLDMAKAPKRNKEV